ncbi:MAG: hypothetical protein HY908_19905 [Myxococcales bacterium]|nr:hypothetical protein [Myxococcales bacterium]
MSAPLPGPLDYETMMPPARVSWIRRVGGENLWVWYTFNASTVYVGPVTAQPPVPLP